jgi:squalene-associated FAD-dependent desaturase
MPSVVIVGGGLAGLSTAVALAPHGYDITILEARTRLGGRASSFYDPGSTEWVDTCQHVSMGCCTAFHDFCKTLGVLPLLEPQPTLFFQTPDRRTSRFKADPWPAPFHLARALASAHYLSMSEKLRVASGVIRLVLEKKDLDEPLLPWLKKHAQSERTIRRFWAVVLVSALNDTVDQLGTKYARKVFFDGFLKDRDGFTVHLPTVPLARLYGEELHAWCRKWNVTIREDCAVRSIEPNEKPFCVRTRNGDVHLADRVVLAVPFDRVNSLLPESWANRQEFANLENLTPSPITSVHVWTDRAVMTHPHVVIVDGLGHWIFNRGRTSTGEWYQQVVISATRELATWGREKITEAVLAELHQLLPDLATARVLRSRVITEHKATFSAVPGVDQLRPTQATSIPGLFLAGDYTQTGWPATMEGAVRSGQMASGAIRAAEGP